MIFRYSLIQDYLTCPKAFYDRHILGKIETEKSANLEYGTAIHLGIRTILEGEDGAEAFNMYWNTLKDSRLKYYDQSWASLKELGEHFLGNFKSRHAKKFTEFKQEVQMEMPFLIFEGGHTLQGTADLVGLYEGKLSIADWKTSSKSYKKNKIELNLQMYIYSKLYEHNFGKLPEQILYKVFNKKDGNINTIVKQLNPIELSVIFNSVEHVSRNILQSIENKSLWHGADCYCERF